MKNSNVVAGPLGGQERSLEKNYLSGALIWAEALCSVGAPTARLPACGGRSLLTAAAQGAAPRLGQTCGGCAVWSSLG